MNYLYEHQPTTRCTIRVKVGETSKMDCANDVTT